MSGEVPEGWAVATVSDVATVVTGKTPSTKVPEYWDGDIPFVTPTDLTGSPYVGTVERYVTREGARTAKLIPEGSVVYTCIASIGKSGLTTVECLTNQQINACIPKQGMDAYYLLQSLRLRTPEIQRLSGTTAVPIVNKTQFSAIQVAVPPLPEQQKIAEVLTSVDDAIQATEAVIEQTKKVKQGVMNQLLTKGIGHTRFKQTEIGEIPEVWEVVRLEELVSRVDSGWSPNCPKVAASESEWGVLKTSAVTWDGFDSAENKKLPDNLTPKPSMEVKARDVLITRAGPKDRTGVVAFVRSVRPKLMLSDKIIRLSTDPHKADPEFLSYLLSSPHGQVQLMRKKSGMAESQTNISQAIIRETLVAAPPVSEQREVVRVLSSLEACLESLRQERAGFVTFKCALMMDLLTGKKRAAI